MDMLADYHLHTEFSDDSKESMEKQVKRAIELGFDEICFTDHVDYGIKKDWEEGEIQWRRGDGLSTDSVDLEPLANVDYPRYFEKLKQMRQQYGSQIVIRQGLEFGVQTVTIDSFQKLYERYRNELDFTLLSMHQIDNRELGMTQDYQRGKTQQEYNEGYYNEIYEVQKRFSNYCVLAHLDLMVRYDLQGIYPFEKVEDKIAEILKLAIRDGKGIEINTSSWHYGLKDTMPSRKILKLYKDLGGTIVTIGSDAHTVKYLGDHIRDAQEILKNEIGIDHICTYEKMIPLFHEI